MFEIFIIFLIALFICLGIMIVLINHELNIQRDFLKIFNEHLDNELKNQEKAIKQLDELLATILKNN